MLKDLDQDNPATPAEKPTFRKSRASRKPTRCCDVCTCTCPAMILNSSPFKPQQKQNQNKMNDQQQQPQKSKICPRLLRHNKPMDTTTDNSASNLRRDGAITMTTNGNGVELVPLLARRRAYDRPISLSTTDVTKRTASNDRYASKLNTNMHCNNNNIINNNKNSNNIKYNNNNSNNISNTNSTTCCLKKFTLHIR